MSIIQLNFYDETLNIHKPSNFGLFKKIISDRYSLDPYDVNELVIFYKDGEDKISIFNEEDYQQALKLVSDESAKKQNFILQIFLEVSEKSKLYLREFESSKIENKSSINSNEENLEKERIRREILEKETQLKELIERERLEAESKFVERLKMERTEKRERLEREQEARRLDDQMIRIQEETQRLEKEKKEEAERISKEIENQLRNENQQREKEEKDLKYKEELKEIISKSVIDTINQNIEKLREDLIQKTILETSKAVEKCFNKNSNVEQSENTSIHQHHQCDGCGVFPIVGLRFKCTECRDFDFCEKCEKELGEGHIHPMTKHRIPVSFKGRCGRFGGRRPENCQSENKNESQEKPHRRHCGFEKHPFMDFMKDQLKNVKDIFCSKDGKINIDLNGLKDLIPNETLQKDVSVTESINLEKKDESRKENNIQQEQIISEDEKNLYRNQLQNMRDAFYFGDFSDDQILEALVKSKGNTDEAFNFLF